MARRTVKPMAKTTTKQKQGRPANSASKQARKWIHTGFRDNQPLICQGLDGLSFFFAKVSYLLKPYLQKRRFSSSKSSYQIRRFFFTVSSLSNDFSYHLISAPQFSLS